MNQKQEANSSISDITSIEYSWKDYMDMVKNLHRQIISVAPLANEMAIHLLGIPRGGMLVAYHLSYLCDRYVIHSAWDYLHHSTLPGLCRFIVDDVLEQGTTRGSLATRWKVEEDGLPPFFVLVNKSSLYDVKPADGCVVDLGAKLWITFPYENPGDVREQESKRKRGYSEG